MLERDESTLKLQRDQSSGKLIRPTPTAEECQFCKTTPEYITFTVQGLTECPCAQLGSIESWKPQGIATALNGQSFALPQFGGDLAEYFRDDPCEWVYRFDGYFGTVRVYYSLNCTGPYHDKPIEQITISAQRTANRMLLCAIEGINHEYFKIGISWLIYVWGTWVYPSQWVSKSTSIANCMTVSSLPNQLVCGVDATWLCAGGIMTLTEGIIPGLSYSQYRVPTGDASVQWTPGVENYKQVADAPGAPDDDTSYTYTTVGGYRDLFNFTPFNVPTGKTITNVQVIGRFKRIDAGGSLLARNLLRVNGITYEGPAEQFVLGAYFTRTATWSINPQTGLAWTVADVNGTGTRAIQNFGYECLGFQKTVRCTQVYIKVTYGD